MPLITETYYLSLTQDNRGILRLRCSQDDTLRTANLKLYNNGSVFTIPGGISAYVSGVKQNGTVFSKSCTISQDRKSVVLQLSSDITNVDGVIIAEVVLNDGNGDRLGTSNFIIQVEKNPTRVGVIQDTETPIEYVNDFITQIQALTARVNNLITPNGDPSLAEVVDARISSLDGNTYQNLKARIDADIATLNTRKANKSEVYTKSQVDNLLENVEIDVDNAFSDESENPIQNRVVASAISEINESLSHKIGLSEEAKQALLACFRNVPALSNTDYYANLEDALYPDSDIARIEATFNQGSFVVYESTPLNELKAHLTVTGYYTDGTFGIITDYALSGTLSVGTSTITVTAGRKSTTFNVTVSSPYWDYEWNAGDGIPTFLSDPDNFAHTDFTSDGYITGNNMSGTRFTIIPISEGGDQVIEVEFMINDPSIGTGYQIGVLTGTGLGGKLLSDGNTTVKVNKTEYSAQIASNTWNTARVEVRNGTISYYLNGSPIAENIAGYVDSYIDEYLQIIKPDCFTRAIRVKVL